MYISIYIYIYIYIQSSFWVQVVIISTEGDARGEAGSFVGIYIIIYI